MDRSVALVNANFRLFRIPLLYMPYATAPAGHNLRQSGFLLPEFSDTTLKGVVLGDAYYWAPKDWTDLSLGGAISAGADGSRTENSAPSPGKM